MGAPVGVGEPASLGSAAPGAAPSKGGGWDTHLRAPPWEWAAWAEGPVTVWPPPAWRLSARAPGSSLYPEVID